MRNAFGLGIVGLVGGAILLYVGLKERAVANRASAVPEEISLANLIARGPAGNTNIIVKDFVVCENFALEQKTTGGRWTKVWVPIVPSSAVPPGQINGGRPTKVQALIFSINIGNQGELQQKCSGPKLRALLTNGLVSLGSEERNLLSGYYPATDFDKCLIIQEGREPAGAGKQILMIGGGIVLALGGLGALGFGFYQMSAEQRPTTRKKRPRSRRVADEEEDDDERPRKRRRVVEEVEEEESRPRKSRRDDDDDRPRKRRRDDDEDEEDDRPRKRRHDVDDDEEERPRQARRKTRRDDDDD